MMTSDILLYLFCLSTVIAILFLKKAVSPVYDMYVLIYLFIYLFICLFIFSSVSHHDCYVWIIIFAHMLRMLSERIIKCLFVCLFW